MYVIRIRCWFSIWCFFFLKRTRWACVVKYSTCQCVPYCSEFKSKIWQNGSDSRKKNEQYRKIAHIWKCETWKWTLATTTRKKKKRQQHSLSIWKEDRMNDGMGSNEGENCIHGIWMPEQKFKNERQKNVAKIIFST